MAARAGSPLSVAAAAQQAFPKEGSFGLNVHHYEHEPEAFPLVAEARVGWVRLAAWWRFMQPEREQPINFGYLERSVDAALAHGLKVLIVFASIPGWANDTDKKLGIMDPAGARPPKEPHFFPNFVTAVVQHFRGRVKHYEIWNEPNYSFFWNPPKNDPDRYGRFIREILIPGAQAVKAADPSAKTMGPATDSKPQLFARAAVEACGHLDILSCHLYNKQQSAAVLFEKAEAHHQLVKERCNKPIWVTEFGVASWKEDDRGRELGEDAQAKELAAVFEGLGRQRPYLQRVFLFEWRDGYWPHQGQVGVGLVSNAIEGYRRKKSFWAVQELALKRLRQPGVASSPTPADGATNVPLAAPLTWSAGLRASSHRISFGPESPPAFKRVQPDRTFPASAAPREHGRTYFWRVDEVGSGGATTTGSLWRFTVEEDPASAGKPLVVRVQKRAQRPKPDPEREPFFPFFLTVAEGQCNAECAPVRSLVLPDTLATAAKGGEWTIFVPDPAPDLTCLRPVSTAAAALTITLSGLRPGESYKVFGRFVTTTQQDSRRAAIRMGLGPATMVPCGAATPGAVIVNAKGVWNEREVEIGSARAEGGVLRVLLDREGAREVAGWSGLRLETGRTG
jgi:putative glycosyl hydrolase